MFISLHYGDGTPFKMNVSHLVMYYDYAIYTDCDGCYPVKETMKEITDQLMTLNVGIALGKEPEHIDKIDYSYLR